MKRKDINKKGKSSFFIKFFKEHKKICVALIICVSILGCFITVNYGRYIKNIIEVYYLRTQNFYFTSDKLTINGRNYEIEPWGGTLEHRINISMSSLLNSLEGTTVDILYDVNCETDGKVLCGIDVAGDTEDHRTIGTLTHSDNFTVIVSPKENVQLKDGDRVKVNLKVKSTKPYVEELSATFILIIGNYGLNYEIEDEKGRVYLDSIITNTLDTQTAIVTLTISDTDNISFDMTNAVLKQEGVTTTTKSDAEGNEYIYRVKFKVDPKSSMLVRFFKKNANDNYSYILSENVGQPVIEFDPILE